MGVVLLSVCSLDGLFPGSAISLSGNTIIDTYNINQHIDAFVHPSLISRGELRHRARILVGLLGLFSAFCVFYILLVLVTVPLNSAAAAIGVIFPLVLVAFFAGVLLRFRERGDLPFHCNLTILAIYLVVTVTVVISGGPLTAPTTLLLVLPPILAYCLIDNRLGQGWLALTSGTLLLLLIMDTFGAIFPNYSDPRLVKPSQAIVMIAAYLALAGTVYFYDSMLHHYRAERDEEHSKVEHYASHDALTDLANRRLFDQELDRLANSPNRRHSGAKIGLLHIDLNAFKALNDDYGHDTGDEILAALSQRLVGVVRTGDTVARIGGDDFAIITPSLQHHSDTVGIAQKVADVMAIPISVNGHEVTVSASIGVAVYPDQTGDIDRLKELAHLSMQKSRALSEAWHYDSAGEL